MIDLPTMVDKLMAGLARYIRLNVLKLPWKIK